VITIAGQAPNVGVDRVLLVSDGACTPTGDGTNCAQAAVTVNGQSPSPSPSVGVKLPWANPSRATPSVTKMAAYAGAGAVLAAVLCMVFLNIKRRRQPLATVYGGNLEPGRGGWRKSLLVTLVLVIVGGLVGAAVALADSGIVVIDLASAKVSGEAHLVASAGALNGYMVQFGAGAGAAPSAAKTPVPATPTPKPSKSTSVSGGGTTGGSTASASPTPAVSTCTNPSWSTSDATGTDPIGSDDVWWIDNDAWNGSHGPQTLYVCSPSSWYAVSNQTDHGGAVETYPSSEYDIAGRGNATKTIAQYNSINSTFAESFPAAGSWDAAYDLWLNNWSTEIMIWNEWTGTQLYWPDDKSVTVTLGGVPYWFQDLGGEYIFYRQNMVKSGSVDILAAFNYLVSKGYVKSTDVPTQLEYGVEVCSTSGTETFPLTGLTFTLN